MYSLSERICVYPLRMRREGTNLEEVRMEDVLCDYCHSSWTMDRPMIEGHHGSCICGSCLRIAYTAVHLGGNDDSVQGQPSKCTMCLEERTEACFESPAYPEAIICLRCIKMAAKALTRDPDSNWKPPTDEAAS